jgi:transposase InsO family protein
MILSGGVQMSVEKRRRYDREFKLEAVRLSCEPGRSVAGVALSVGSKGDSYDNALAETIIGLYKTEVIGGRGPWRTVEDVEYATLTWVDWFNHRRLLEPIGNIPPAEREERYYLGLETPAFVAGIN